MKRRQTQQFSQLTVRSVPASVKNALAHRARKEQKSLNAVLVDVLTAATGSSPTSLKFRDLEAIAGSWIEDKGFDAALEAQDQVDAELWQ